MTSDAMQREIQLNYDFLMRHLSSYLPGNAGRFAALRCQTVIGIFDDPFDAHLAGKAAAPDGLFSIQEISEQPVELGVYAAYVQPER